MKKSITKIGALVILGILMFATSVPTVLAYPWTEDQEVNSRMIVIDHLDGTPYDDDQAFAIAHDDTREILLIVLEDGGKVGIGEDDPDLKLEVVGSSGKGYFGVSSAKDNDGDIFIIDSSGNVGIGVVGGGSKLNVLGGVTVGLTYAGTGTAPSGGMIIEGSVGIGTPTPLAKLDVEVSGTQGTVGGAATIGSSGCSATGDYAIAMGYDTTASGWYSTALGKGTTASWIYATALGGHTTASSGYATAMGGSTTASGVYSTAMGIGSTASGYYSTAMGYYTTASGECSNSMGYITTASGDYSTAMGYYTTASGDYSFGIGLDYTPGGWTITQDNTMAIMGGKVGIGTVSPSVELDVEGDTKISGYLNVDSGTLYANGGTNKVGINTASPSTNLHVNGDVAFGYGGLLWLQQDDSITVTHSYHLVDAYPASIDELKTINGEDVAGQILVLTVQSGDTITVIEDDNIVLKGNFEMDHPEDTLVLMYNGSDWIELSRSSNG